MTVNWTDRVAAVEGRRSVKVEITSSASMEYLDYPVPEYIISGMRTVGLSILAGPQKKGKSWLELARAIAISEGEKFWDRETKQGEVLYLALEDIRGRIKSRIEMLRGTLPFPGHIDFIFESPRIDEGGLEIIEDWIDTHPNARQIVIDTWVRFSPSNAPKNANIYDAQAAATAVMQDLARKRNVAVVLVMHTNKAKWDDPFDSITGSRGNTVSADTNEVLVSKSDGTTTLYTQSRNFEADPIEMVLDGGRWTLVGYDENEMTEKQKAAVKFLMGFLSGGRRPQKEIFAEGQKIKIGRDSIYKAQKLIGIKATRTYTDKGVPYFEWELPATPLTENPSTETATQDLSFVSSFKEIIEFPQFKKESSNGKG